MLLNKCHSHFTYMVLFSLKNVLELTHYFIKKTTFYNIQIMRRKNRPIIQRQICKELPINSGYLTLINFECSRNYFTKHSIDNGRWKDNYH